MRKYILSLILILSFAPAFAQSVQNYGFSPIGNGFRPYKGFNNYYNRNYPPPYVGNNLYGNGYGRYNRYNRRFDPLRRGTITGFTPPVYNSSPCITQSYTSNNGSYYSNPYYSDNSNLSLKDKIKSFFDPTYKPAAQNNPYPIYQNGNYTPIFSNDPTGTNSGVSVQVID